MPIKKTHEQFLKEINGINTNILIMGDYQGTHVKIKCKCLIDDYVWDVTPDNLLQGKGCPKCGGTKKKTHEEFKEELKLVNHNIELINKYIDSKHKVMCKCLIDDFIWQSLPQNLLKGHGCPKCDSKKTSERLTFTQEEFESTVKSMSPNINIISSYKNSTNKVKCKCSVCDNIWKTVANNLLNGKGCSVCGIKSRTFNLTKTHNEFVTELKNVNSNIEIISQYVKSTSNINCKCKICQHEWKATPTNLLSGKGCPKCKISYGENKISKKLDELHIEYIIEHTFDDCRNIRPLPFDFYLPDYNTCIEYDGQHHFYPVNFGGMSDERAIKHFETTRNNDLKKNRYCKENNIDIIRIKYTEFNNIDEIIENKFLS